jgi:RimJ/RimL family protein N-acetyltransferase
MTSTTPRSPRGELVYLRPSERSDIPLFVRWFADAEVTRFLQLRAPFSEASEEKWFDEMTAAQGTKGWHFVICRLDTDEPIGTAGLFDLNGNDGNAEFGISLGEKSAWNQGFGTDALRAICDFGFGELRLERIHLQVYAPNARAIRSYEKAGFVREGTLREAHYSEGRHHDIHLMSLLRSDWETNGQPKSWELNGFG